MVAYNDFDEIGIIILKNCNYGAIHIYSAPHIFKKLNGFLEHIIRDAMAKCVEAKRNTVIIMDVIHALKRQVFTKN